VELFAYARFRIAQACGDGPHGRLLADGMDAFCNVLCQIADALQIVGNAHGRDDLAQVDGDRLASGDGQYRLLLDVVLQAIDGVVGGNDLPGQNFIAVQQCEHRVVE
jgi:hypothetical protein